MRKFFAGRLALPALLLLTPSCATTNLWSWGLGGGDDGVYWESDANSAAGEFGRGLTALVFLAPALAWDVLTFPYQVYADLHPYGPKNAP